MILIYINKYENFKLIEDYLIHCLKYEYYDDIRADILDTHILITDEGKIIFDNKNISKYIIRKLYAFKDICHMEDTYFIKEIRKIKFKNIL